MSVAIQVRRTPDGRIQARRVDGKPLTARDREEARTLAAIYEIPCRAWVVEEIRGGSLQAVKICSEILADHLWLIVDHNYHPSSDGLAIYYPEELGELGTKTVEQLREIHSIKLAFPGARVIQEGAQS
jgi:hypothetical protein